MSGLTWSPPDIAAICPEQNAPLTQCSATGYMFLALITQLYGGSRDGNEFPDYWQYPSEASDFSGSPVQNFENSQIPLDPTPFKPKSASPHPSFAPVLHEDFLNNEKYSSVSSSTKVHSHGPGFSRGLSETSSYFPQFDFEAFGKAFDKTYGQSDPFRFDNEYKKPKNDYKFENSYRRPFPLHPSVDYDFSFGKKSYFDADTADSEKVTVRQEKKRDANSRKRRASIERYDFIVVGAGSAGCVIANRLSEVKQWKVLLLEAGPEEPEVTSVPAFAPVLGQSSIDWMYRTQPEELTCRAQRGQTCAWLSGRVMGGSSSINYVVYMRGNKKDYDEWDELGNDGWSFEDVLPFFKKSENNKNAESKDVDFHGTGGPVNVERFAYTDDNGVMLVKAFNEKGLRLVDFNGKKQIGTMTTQTTTKNGRRVSSNEAFIRPIRNKRHNLVIRPNSQVTKIMIDESKNAYGVRYVKNGILYEVYANKEIILSAGALNSPKILMLSGIGPKDDIEILNIPCIMNLKVGYNLQDHATTEAVLIGLSNHTSTLLSRKQMMKAIKNYYIYRNNKDPLAATGPLHVTAFYRTMYAGEDESVPDIQFHFDGRNKKDFYADPTTYLATNIFPLSYYDSINVRPILLRPESRGYLTLNRTHPVFSQPLIYPRFFTVQKDLDTLVAALKFATKLENTKAFKEAGAKFMKRPVEPCSQYTWGGSKYFACVLKSYTGTIYHPAGTCKMGPSYDNDAVVDARLRVYGIDNLRVADASIMPNIVRGNTNAPCMMIGEKASAMIKEDWGLEDIEP